MAHAGDALDAPDGLLTARPAHGEEGDDGASEGHAEQPQHDLVRQLGKSRPQAGERDQDEQPGESQ
jgi:hypothetical protein